jgi:hypothetical protein
MAVHSICKKDAKDVLMKKRQKNGEKDVKFGKNFIPFYERYLFLLHYLRNCKEPIQVIDFVLIYQSKQGRVKALVEPQALFDYFAEIKFCEGLLPSF